MRTMRKMGLALLLALVLLLAACDTGDDDDDANSAPALTPTVETAAPDGDAGGEAGTADSGGFNPGGTGLTLGSSSESGAETGLPGCSDPDDEACPAALQMELDGEVSAGGVTIQYPERYFDALAGAGAPGDVLIRIEPSENNRYAEEAVFQVYPAESVEAALEALVEPETAEWATDTLTGQIGVSKDAEQDPPVNTTIGAFEAANGRVIVLELTTTGKYGWDLWLLVYRDMLATMTVTDPTDAG